MASERPGDVVAVERHGARRVLTIGDLVAGASAERPIVVWLPNRIEWIEAVAAAARLGAPIVCLNPRYRADELRDVLERSNAGVLVAVDEFAGISFAELAAAAGTCELASVVIVGAPREAWGELGCPVVTWESLDGDGWARSAPQPSDLLVAFTTSGTTGFPKLETLPTINGPNGVKIRKSELRDRAARELDDADR